MNLSQKAILLVGLLLILARGLFPPTFERVRLENNEEVLREYIDHVRLSEEWVMVVVATSAILGLLSIMATRPPRPVYYDVLLEKQLRAKGYFYKYITDSADNQVVGFIVAANKEPEQLIKLINATTNYEVK